MSRGHVGHSELAKFAEDRVNLPQDRAGEYRAQVRRLKEKLEGYLSEHPDFTLKKILLSGSLAKGTALRSINDIDVACYVAGAAAPKDVPRLLAYLADRLRTAFPNFKPDQVQPQTFSVTVSFRGSGLDVDVVPVIYHGDPNWHGDLVSQEDGSFLETNIPRHLEFVRKRKKDNGHFAQVVRLAKFWAKRLKNEREGFRFKSFMVELLLARLSDEGLDFADYPDALQHFFTYLARTELREQIVFPDYYDVRQVAKTSDRVQIVDPVNKKNNVSKLYTSSQVAQIVEAAMDAGDAIDAALAAPTKAETLRYWQKVFGPSFAV